MLCAAHQIINCKVKKTTEKHCKQTEQSMSDWCWIFLIFSPILNTINEHTLFYESNIFPRQSHLPLCSRCGCRLFLSEPHWVRNYLLASAIIFPDHLVSRPAIACVCVRMYVCVCVFECDSERGCGSDPAVISLTAKGFLTPASSPLQVLLMTDRIIWRCWKHTHTHTHARICNTQAIKAAMSWFLCWQSSTLHYF